MPQLIPFAIGAAKGFAIFKGVQAVTGLLKAPVNAANQQATDVAAQNAANIAGLKEDQANASTAAAQTIQAKRKRQTRTVFTSPLGIEEEATISKKKLLGD